MKKICEICGKPFVSEDEKARACFECFEKSGLIEIMNEYFEQKKKDKNNMLQKQMKLSE